MDQIQHLIDNALENIAALSVINEDALRDGDLRTSKSCSYAVVKLNKQIDAWRKELEGLKTQSYAVLQQDDEGNLWAIAA